MVSLRTPAGRAYLTHRLWRNCWAADTVPGVPSSPESIRVQRRLGLAVKAVRQEKAITQEELSRRTGLHPTYISDIERGARNPSFAVLVRLTGGLGIGLGELGDSYDQLD